MGDDTDSEDVYVWWKLFLGATIAVSSAIGVFFPKLLLKWCASNAEKIMALSNAFAGGVVLGVALIHLLPEAMDDFAQEHPDVNAPIILYSCSFGFMLLILVENLVLGQKERIETHCAKDDTESECICTQNGLNSLPSSPTTTSVLTTPQSAEVPSYGLVGGDTAINSATASNNNNTNTYVTTENGGFLGGEEKGEVDVNEVDEFTSYTLMCALCFHSVIEGFALGMLTDLPDLILVYIAIISHKAVAAFALGTSMMKAELPSFRYGVLASIFIGSTPLGMILAIIVLETLQNSSGSTAIVTLVTEGVAAGTFLFVATMEIFAEEFHCKDPLFYPKFALAVVGVIFMAVVSIYC